MAPKKVADPEALQARIKESCARQKKRAEHTARRDETEIISEALFGILQNELPERFRSRFCQGRQTGEFQTGGFPDLDLSFLFWSFLGLSRFFRDFPDLLGDGPGIFPIRPFSLSLPIKSTYAEQSRKGLRHNDCQSGPFPKKVRNPPVWKPPRFSFSQF